MIEVETTLPGIVVSSFEATEDCDPSADDADLQVIQAFFTAYNQRNEEVLAALVGPSPLNGAPFHVHDAAGVPHLGSPTWGDGVEEWAAVGWGVEDRFELTELRRYGARAGSVFALVRTNTTLEAHGIDSIRHAGKAHSQRCTISFMVLYLPNHPEPTAAECLFFEVFAETLEERLPYIGTGTVAQRTAGC